MLLPFVLGFDDSTAALLFDEIVGGADLPATLATRFEPRVPGGASRNVHKRRERSWSRTGMAR